jgi:hypothetical protein
MGKPSGTERCTVVLASEADVHYWAQRLQVSEFRLWKAVTTVGDSLADVERYLRDESSERS